MELVILIYRNNSLSDAKLKIYDDFDAAISYTVRLGIWLHSGAKNNKLKKFIFKHNVKKIS